MAKRGRNKPRGGSNLTKEQAQKIALNIASTALFILPGGQVVRAAVTAGKVAPKALQMIRSLGGKKIAKPTQAQITKSKPVSALPAPKPSTGTAVAKRPSTAVKTQGKAVGPKKPSGQPREMKNITPIKRTKITTKPPKKSTKPISKGKAAAIIGTTAGLTGAALLGSKGQKKAAASVTAPTSRPKRSTKRTGMSEGNTVAGSSGRRGGDPRKGFASKATPGAKPIPKRKPKDKSDPRGNQIKATSSLPAGALRKFQGSYNKKTEKLRNIGGKTYVVKR
jgi:hypothetical protein